MRYCFSPVQSQTTFLTALLRWVTRKPSRHRLRRNCVLMKYYEPSKRSHYRIFIISHRHSLKIWTCFRIVMFRPLRRSSSSYVSSPSPCSSCLCVCLYTYIYSYVDDKEKFVHYLYQYSNCCRHCWHRYYYGYVDYDYVWRVYSLRRRYDKTTVVGSPWCQQEILYRIYTYMHLIHNSIDNFGYERRFNPINLCRSG